MESQEAHQEFLGEDSMDTESITVIEGEDTIRTLLSLQFVYKGSTESREYGCFISGAKTLREIEVMMYAYGMPPERVSNFPSIVMLDAGKLKEISLKNNGNSFKLEILLNLLEEIYKDVNFTRLAVDRFDLLSEESTRKDMENFFNFVRMNRINVILTVDLNKNFDFFDIYDNYIVVRKGLLPPILFH